MISISEAARILGVSRPTIYQALRDGRLVQPITQAQLDAYQPAPQGRPMQPDRTAPRQVYYDRNREQELIKSKRRQIFGRQNNV